MRRGPLGVRTSTWAIMTIFVAALVTYLLVQPTTPPAGGTRSGTATLVPTGVPSITHAGTSTTPSPTLTATPTSTPMTRSTSTTPSVPTASTVPTTGSPTGGPSTTVASSPAVTSR